MDPVLRSKAEKFFETKSKLKGEEYLDSELRRIVHMGLAISTSPLWGLVAGVEAGAVYLEDKKWPFENLGLEKSLHLNEKVDWFKIRTMIPNARATESDYAEDKELNQVKGLKYDLRITKTGGIIRKTHLDDLPLLANVAMGGISLTGPRLPAQTEWAKIVANAHIEPYHAFIESTKKGIKFGITGMFVVFREEASKELADRIALENMWLENVSLKSELETLLITISSIKKPTG